MGADVYYVTKYALSTGVQMIPRNKAEVVQYSGRPFLVYGNGAYRNSAHNDDWHEKREAAEAHVAKLKAKRRKSLEKSLRELEKDVRFYDFDPSAV